MRCSINGGGEPLHQAPLSCTLSHERPMLPHFIHRRTLFSEAAAGWAGEFNRQDDAEAEVEKRKIVRKRKKRKALFHNRLMRRG